MPDLSWMTARPIAHRGLHDAASGRIENTLSAVRAAVDRGFNIEIDVHLSADGVVFVHHDDALGRLNEGEGRVAARRMDELRAVPFRATSDRIPALSEVLALVAGRVGLVIELKSYFAERQKSLVEAAVRTLESYAGPVALKSFDPRMVADVAELAPAIPRGIIADSAGTPSDYNQFRFIDQKNLATLGHIGWSKFQFVSYWNKLLPNDISRRVRGDWGMPLITWTIRSREDRARAGSHADQIVFEGFDPDEA